MKIFIKLVCKIKSKLVCKKSISEFLVLEHTQQKNPKIYQLEVMSQKKLNLTDKLSYKLL